MEEIKHLIRIQTDATGIVNRKIKKFVLSLPQQINLILLYITHYKASFSFLRVT